jgi:AcrR family transcriptional regulator
MPKIVDREERRQTILAVASRTFSRYGYRGTNLQRVAADAGMGKSSLYHYFPTKEALFAALVNDLLRHEVALFDQAVAGNAPPAARFGKLVETLLTLFDSWADAGPLLIDCLREAQGRRVLRRTLQRVRRTTRRLIRQGQRDGSFRGGDAGAMATVVIGCLDGALLQELLEPGCTRSPSVRRMLCEMLARALGDGGRR